MSTQYSTITTDEVHQFEMRIHNIRKICNDVPQETRQQLREMCGDYADAILFALVYLFEEQERSGVSNAKITSIIHKSFNLPDHDAKHIVACYKDIELIKTSDARTQKSKKKKELNFSSQMMDYACQKDSAQDSKKVEMVTIPEEIKEEILRLSNNALPISEILSAKCDKNGIYMSQQLIQISESLLVSVNTKIEQFDSVFDKFQNKDYWRLFLKYVPKLSNNGYFLDYLRLFPMLDEKCIQEFKRDTPSSKSYDDLAFTNEYLSPLLNYADELEHLEYNSEKDFDPQERRELFGTLTVQELNQYACLIPYMERVSVLTLRPVDLRTIHWLLTMFKPEELEFFMEEVFIPKFESGKHVRLN